MRPRPSKTSTTRLPLALREELGLPSTDHHDERKRGLSHNDGPRKTPYHATARRDDALRLDRRKRPASEYQRELPQGRPFSKRPRLDDVKKGRRNEIGQNDVHEARSARVGSTSTSASKPPTKKKDRPQTALERLVAKQEGSSSRSTQQLYPAAGLTEVEKEEEDEIAWLEAKLGKSGKKGKQKAEEDDGLDDLLGDLDRVVSETRGGKTKTNPTSQDQSDGDSVTYDDDDEEITEDESESSSRSDSEAENALNSEGPAFSEMESDIPDELDTDSEDAPSDRAKKIVDHKASAGRYIPPALRKSDSTATKTEAQIKLGRQVKGLLNKLSEQNIGSILEEIESLYRVNVRHDVTSALTELVLASISNHASLLDTFVILHAALIASLYRLLGIEFAASFVQALVSEYEKHYGEALTDPARGKEASNLLVLLAELYTFQVVSCVLVYDIIRSFLGSALGEFEVELFLKLLKGIGMQLRQDDPTALKEIVQLVQAKSAGAEQTSRTRYMLETLTNLKNNKIVEKKKVAGANGSMTQDAVDKMKRFVKSLSSKKTGKPQEHAANCLLMDSFGLVRAHEPLNVTLEDLHSVDKKGKWWLVGSAWGGDPLVDAKRDQPLVRLDEEPLLASDDQAATLLKLAKKQGMNTDVRRKIFVVLMSSEDYVDACDRLGQLSITEQQRPEIILVLLHCLGNEKAYNPYYTLVAQQLSGLNRNVRFSLQYCLWDLFKEFGEQISSTEEEREEKTVSKTRIRNVAKAFAWWVAKGAVALDIFKSLNLFALKPQTTTFLRMFFAQLFISSQSASPILDFATKSEAEAETLSKDREVLEVIVVKSVKFPGVVQGILHFLDHEDLEALAGCDGIKRSIRWGVKIAKDTLESGVEVSNL